MDTHTALTTRRTVHYWKPQQMPKEVLDKALGAAHLAPCHRYTWPWRFNKVGANARGKLFALAVQLKKGKREHLPASTLAVLKRKIQNPAELIVVSIVRNEDGFINRENYAAACCAIQNMSLSLHASGYGAKWSTGKVTRHHQTYEILNIDERTEEIIGFIWAGVPESTPKVPERPDINSHIRNIE